MPSICLNANEKNYKTYKTGDAEISVANRPFEESNLFIFCEHTPDNKLDNDDIYAYKTNATNQGTLTIKKNTSYSNNSVSCARVYFNKYDDKYHYPLILLLHFTDNPKAPSRYYRMSKFVQDKLSEVNISDLDEYSNEKELFNELIHENEKVTHFLTYDIGMSKKVDSDRYNNNKIIISHKQEVFRKYIINSDGFYKYTHTPSDVNRSNQYKSLITYNKGFPKKDLGDKTSDLEEIQAKHYQSVNVYFGSKVKIKGVNGTTDENVPLMVELVRSDRPKDFEYYCHHQNTKGLYWEKLEAFNYEKYTGSKPKGLVAPTNLTNNNQMLLKILKRLEFYFLKTLVIMINKQESYKKVNIVESYIDYNKSTIINEASDLPVAETTHLRGCLKNTGFKVFEHDLSFFEAKHEDYQIKFIIPTTDIAGKYNEITLYSYKNFRSEHIENLSFFQNGYGENKVKVYFYDRDPRPLLVSFGEKAYKPKNKNKYSTEWVRIKDFDDYLEDNGPSLLKQLFEVVGFLNEVNLYEHYDYYSHQGRDYEVQTYDNSKKYINVTKSNLDCYIKYEHKPKINQGYRLGKIVYKKDNEEKGNINYNYTSPLVQVNVYYYNNDTKRDYPLLVELEFQNNSDNLNIRTKEHYKLLKSDFNDVKWTADYHARQVDDSKNLIAYLDHVKNSFNYVEELKGFSSYCNHNHLANPTFPGPSYIMPSHTTDDSLHGQSSSYTHQNTSHPSQVTSHISHSRSPPSRGDVLATNQHGRMSSSQQTHSHQPPPETGVEKATRIASTVGTFAIAGTGTGVAIYKYSHWIINFFKRFF